MDKDIDTDTNTNTDKDLELELALGLEYLRKIYIWRHSPYSAIWITSNTKQCKLKGLDKIEGLKVNISFCW